MIGYTIVPCNDNGNRCYAKHAKPVRMSAGIENCTFRVLPGVLLSGFT